MGRLLREEIVGWNHDTLVRFLWDGDVLGIDVIPEAPIVGCRNRLRNSWKALRGRPGGDGFDLTSESDCRRLRNALEAPIPLEKPGVTDTLTPGGAATRWFVPTACTEGCIVSVRAYPRDRDDAGWVSIDLISNAMTRRDGSLCGRLANALVSLGRVGAASWCPLVRTIELRAALASASSAAFPHLGDASRVPRRGIPKNQDNGKDGTV